MLQELGFHKCAGLPKKIKFFLNPESLIALKNGSKDTKLLNTIWHGLDRNQQGFINKYVQGRWAAKLKAQGHNRNAEEAITFGKLYKREAYGPRTWPSDRT